jgi:hypothetical protein
MRNYGGQGWEGAKYQQTENLDVVDIAKLIKKEAQAKFPSLQLSIKTSRFAGGESIRLGIEGTNFEIHSEDFKECVKNDKFLPFGKPRFTEKATEVKKELEKVVNQYRYNDSNGMIDYFDTNFYSSVDYKE